MLDYIQALYFRYLFGIVDAANRNFLIANGNLYGIDEENIDMDNESNFSKLTKQFNYINKNWYKIESKIKIILAKWYSKLPELKYILKYDIYYRFEKRLANIVSNPQIFL